MAYLLVGDPLVIYAGASGCYDAASWSESIIASGWHNLGELTVSPQPWTLYTAHYDHAGGQYRSVFRYCDNGCDDDASWAEYVAGGLGGSAGPLRAWRFGPDGSQWR